MANLVNNYETSKVIVDFYHEKKNTEFVCSCYTPGAPTDIESEYLIKTVSYSELKEQLSDSNGNVTICLSLDESAEITFEVYLAGLSSSHIERYLTQIINKRENRSHPFNHQTEAAYL